MLFKSYKWHSGGYSKYIYFNWSSSLLLTLKLKMAKIIPIFKQDDDTTLTIIGRSLCFLISTGSLKKYCLKELSLLLNRRICSLHPNMAFARHILLSMQPRYCECNTDKYEQPFILLWDFHWSKKGFWHCRSRNSLAQVRSLWFSRHYKHLVFFLLARANSNSSNWSSSFWKVRFYL